MPSRLRRKREGFTLIELVMTIVVVAIISIPLSLLVIQHIESVVQSKDYTMAMNLARWEMEIVNNTGYASISTANFPNYKGYPYDLTRTVTFAAGSGASAESLKQITVTVRRSGSATDLVKFITYIARNVIYAL